jgi:hypothetical protein
MAELDKCRRECDLRFKFEKLSDVPEECLEREPSAESGNFILWHDFCDEPLANYNRWLTHINGD